MKYLPDGEIFHIRIPHGMGNMVPFRIIAECGKSFAPEDFPPLLKDPETPTPLCPKCAVALLRSLDDN